MICQRMMVGGGTKGEAWQFTINTEATAQGEKTAGIPFNLYNQPGVKLYVDWGDGTNSTLTEADYSVSDSTASVHEYANAGIYNIIVESKNWDICYILVINSSNSISTVNNAVAPLYWMRRTLVSVDSPLPKIQGTNSYSSPTNVSSLFTTQTLTHLFKDCTSLTTIPSGLFDKNTYVGSFNYCFDGCASLTSIPSGLFDQNTLVTGFSYCFRHCISLTSIPDGLFDHNTKIATFDYCFRECTSLTTIPSGLFDKNTAVKGCSYLFKGCTSLTTIPSGLFDKNTAVNNFSNCFGDCESLQSIPTNLFYNNIAVTSLNSCFTMPTTNTLGDFEIRVGSSLVTNCANFCRLKTGTTRKVYVPSGSTTETTFNAVASGLGLTIIGE